MFYNKKAQGHWFFGWEVLLKPDLVNTSVGSVAKSHFTFPVQKGFILKKITIDNMVKTALFLSLIFVVKIIQKFIPDLPNGLGDITVLLEVLIVAGSIIIGWNYALFATILYLLFGLIDIPIFFGGLLWVQGITKFYVYLLDYFIPLIALCFASLFAKTYKHLIINVIVVNIINYLCHVLSGIIFWGSYAWDGWGPVAYSLAANGIRNLVMLSVTIIIAIPAQKVPKNIFQKSHSWK